MQPPSDATGQSGKLLSQDRGAPRALGVASVIGNSDLAAVERRCLDHVLAHRSELVRDLPPWGDFFPHVERPLASPKQDASGKGLCGGRIDAYQRVSNLCQDDSQVREFRVSRLRRLSLPNPFVRAGRITRRQDAGQPIYPLCHRGPARFASEVWFSLCSRKPQGGSRRTPDRSGLEGEPRQGSCRRLRRGRPRGHRS